MVSHLYLVHEDKVSVPANRKKLRLTTNRSYLNEVWGDTHTKEINIPQFINDYNHTMNAVDRADQLISHYTMKHECYRTWTPLMLYVMNIIRTGKCKGAFPPGIYAEACPCTL